MIEKDAMKRGIDQLEVLGRFISRVEALRIAREILDRAEQERLVIAEYEAAQGIQVDWLDQRPKTHVERMSDPSGQSAMKRENMAEERRPSNPAVV